MPITPQEGNIRDAPNNTYNNNSNRKRASIHCFPLRRIENGRVSGRRLQRLPGTRVEPAPNSKYAPISEMRPITRDYGI